MLNSALHCGRYSQIFFQSTKNEEKCEKYNQYVSAVVELYIRHK